MWKILLTLLAISHVCAQTIYVDKNANNNAAFHTITEAIDSAHAGDTIAIKAGIYHERIYIEKSGTKSQPITIKNYANDNVTIDGTNKNWSGTWGGLFEIANCGYIVVLGLEIKNSTHAGLFLDTAHHIDISNIKTHNTFSSGIGVWDSHDIVVKNNEVSLACNDGEQECISVANSYDVNVTHNEVHHNGAGTNGGEGIDIKQGSHDVLVTYNHVHHLNHRIGLYADAWDTLTYNITFESNRVHDITDTGMVVASELGGTIKNVTFVNNLVYNNHDGGIAIGGWTENGQTVSSHPVEHINIINNTLYHNLGSDGIYIGNGDAKYIKIYNNIIQKSGAYPIYIEYTPITQVDIRKNLIDEEPYAYGQNSEIVGNPLFVDSLHGDFHLQSTSPAINAGVENNLSLFDYDKNSRSMDGQWDIGAFENISNSNFAFLISIRYLLL